MNADAKQPEAPTKSETQPPSTSGSGKPRFVRGCLIFVLSIFLFGAATVFAYQHWFGEEVDPDKIDGKVEEVKTDTPEEITGIVAELNEEAIAKADHPLTPALDMAKKALKQIDENLIDYEAVIAKQCRPGKKLGPKQHMLVKVRHEHTNEDGEKVPFAVYTRFLAPKNIIGQEAIYVDGWNEGRLVAHLPGLLNISRFNYKPTHPLVMAGNLHPITMIGMRNLLVQILDKGERDLNHGECEIELNRNIEVDGRKCMLVTITHPKKRDHFEFHIAKIYIDLEYELPVGYEGYLWPEEEGGEPLLLESYIYTKIQLHKNFTDKDFDPDNEDYEFPK